MSNAVKFPEAVGENNRSLEAAMVAFGQKLSDVVRAADTGTDDPEGFRFVVHGPRVELMVGPMRANGLAFPRGLQRMSFRIWRFGNERRTPYRSRCSFGRRCVSY